MDKHWGNYTAVGSRGSRYGLIGHDGVGVNRWLSEHPDFDGNIYFDYGNDEPQVEVTEEFIPEADEDDLIDAVRTAEAA